MQSRRQERKTWERLTLRANQPTDHRDENQFQKEEPRGGSADSLPSSYGLLCYLHPFHIHTYELCLV